MNPTAPLLVSLGILCLFVSVFVFVLAGALWLIEHPLKRWADIVMRIIGGGGPWRIP